MKKKILISIPFPRMIRYFLDTDLFKDLASGDVDMIIVHNQKDIDKFIQKYPNVSAIPYPKQKQRHRINTIFTYFVNIPYLTKHFIRNERFGINNYFLRCRNVFEKIVILIIIIFVNLLYIIPFIGKYIFRLAFYDKNYETFLIENKIEGVILTAPMLIEDRLFAEAAFRHKIPTTIVTDGWDTLTNFGYLHKYKGVIVWGPEMAKHAQLLGYNNNEIVSSGIPYKEKLINNYNNADIRAIKQKYDIPNDDRVILIFANNWYAQGDIEKKNIELILDAIACKKIQNVKILIRLLPKKNTAEELYYREKYWNNPHIRFQIPSAGYNETFKEIIPENIIQEIADLFAISDLMINILSMSLLEGAIVGVQGIICNYSDVYYPTKYVTNTDIYRSLTLNGIIEVKNSDFLIPSIINCLENSDTTPLQKVVMRWDYKQLDVKKKIYSFLNIC